MPTSILATLLILALSLILSVFASAAGGGFPASVLALERAFPGKQKAGIEVLKSRDRARHPRILQGVAGGVVDLTVTGSSDPYAMGLYYTKVKLGTPPKEFTVQIDTGSDILWLACNSCAGCPQSSDFGIELSFFDVASSSTASMVSCSDRVCASAGRTSAAQCSYASNQCGYSLHYGDGSGTNGYYVSDTLYFDMVTGNSLVANSSVPIIFGCSTYQNGDLTKSDRAIDGIFGFGQQGLSVISQLSARRIMPKVFSHCLNGEGNGGGILVLGEILAPNIVYTPLVPFQPHYNLMMQSIAVNGQLLPIDPAFFETSSNQGTIVDTGTTLAYLVVEAYDPLVTAITAAVSKSATPVMSKGNQCYVVSTSLADLFPSVSLNFVGGASMVLTPKDYLVRAPSDGTAMWCMGFQRSQGQTILGDIILKNKVFVYDLAHQRIGWANYDCSSTVNVSVTTSRDEFINTGQLSVSDSSRTIIATSIVVHSSALMWLLIL